MDGDTLLVVHGEILRRRLIQTVSPSHKIVAPAGATMGVRVDAVVFLDLPDPIERQSETWLDSYQDWVACAVLTRIRPGGKVFGLSDWGKSAYTGQFAE